MLLQQLLFIGEAQHTLLFSSTGSPLELVAVVVRHLTVVVLLLQQLLFRDVYVVVELSVVSLVLATIVVHHLLVVGLLLNNYYLEEMFPLLFNST